MCGWGQGPSVGMPQKGKKYLGGGGEVIKIIILF
jgi:hypothetical protein